MNMFEVWLLLVLMPKLPYIFGPIALVSALAIVISAGWWYCNSKDEHYVERLKKQKSWSIGDEEYLQYNLRNIEGCEKMFKAGLITMLVSSLLVAAAPNKKELAAIVLIPYVSNNPECKKLPENIVGMLDDLIKEYRKELRPK